MTLKMLNICLPYNLDAPDSHRSKSSSKYINLPSIVNQDFNRFQSMGKGKRRNQKKSLKNSHHIVSNSAGEINRQLMPGTRIRSCIVSLSSSWSSLTLFGLREVSTETWPELEMRPTGFSYKPHTSCEGTRHKPWNPL